LTSSALLLFIAVTAKYSFPKHRFQALIFKIPAFAKLAAKYRPGRSDRGHLATLFLQPGLMRGGSSRYIVPGPDSYGAARDWRNIWVFVAKKLGIM